MQLKIKRSQRAGGVVSKNMIFCIDAMVSFTHEEKANITRYKLQNQIIYDSEAAKRMWERSEANRGHRVEYFGSAKGMLRSMASTVFAGVKSIAFAGLAMMQLRLSIGSLERGQHAECKSLDELIEAENAIMQACQNLKGYLDTAATFDGREVLFDYSTGSPEAVAISATPTPMLISAPEPGVAASAPDVIGFRDDTHAQPPNWQPEEEQLGAPQTHVPHAASDDDSVPFFELIKSNFALMPTPARVILGLLIVFLLFELW